MEAVIRLATKEYCFVEFKVEGTVDEILAQNQEIMWKSANATGISDRDYNAFIDRMLLGDTNHVEEYQAMSAMQKDTVQVIKRSLKRIAAKEQNHLTL